MSIIYDSVSNLISDGTRTSDVWVSGPNHNEVFDAKLKDSIIYILSLFNSITLIMTYDTLTQSAGGSFSLQSTFGSFIENDTRLLMYILSINSIAEVWKLGFYISKT